MPFDEKLLKLFSLAKKSKLQNWVPHIHVIAKPINNAQIKDMLKEAFERFPSVKGLIMH